MKFLFDLFPVLLFFIIFTWAKGDPVAAQAMAEKYLSFFVEGHAISAATTAILLATAVTIIATVAQIVFLLVRRNRVEPMLWVSFAIVSLFGGATIYFGSEDFIKWKPTVLYWFFGAAILIAQMGFGKNLVRMMMEKQIQLPDPVWKRLCFAWMLFFILMGVINLYVAFWGGFTTATWVSFKLFGGIGLMFVFVVGQSIYLARYINKPQ